MTKYQKNKEDYNKLFEALKEVRRLTEKLEGNMDFNKVINWLQRI